MTTALFAPVFIAGILETSAGLTPIYLSKAHAFSNIPEIPIYSTIIVQSNPRMKAVNIARMRAEKINGGLKDYRAAHCMYASGGGECLVANNQNGFLFRFLGGKPGWEQLGIGPTVETEILISPDGSTVLQLYYNGPLK